MDERGAGRVEGILSIQSAVAYGHAGNSAAVFPLQRLGFEVWPVDTVHFSNHTGYGAWRGHVHSPEQIDAIVQGIGERGAFAACQAVLSGYLGDVTLGRSVLKALAAVRALRPEALYLCDPVIGDDDGGVFVREGIAEFFREHAVPAADITTPNRFELEHLTGLPVASIEQAQAAAAALRERGPRIVVVTSLVLPERPGEIMVLADTAEACWLVRTPRLPIALNGGGDSFSALFLGHRLRCKDLATALARTVSAMYALVEATFRAGARELLLVAAQESFATPPRLFPAERLR